MIAYTPAPYRRAGSVSDAATGIRVAASSSRVRARRVGAVAAWEGRSLLLFLFQLLGTLSGAVKVPLALLVDAIDEACAQINQ